MAYSCNFEKDVPGVELSLPRTTAAVAEPQSRLAAL